MSPVQRGHDCCNISFKGWENGDTGNKMGQGAIFKDIYTGKVQAHMQI